MPSRLGEYCCKIDPIPQDLRPGRTLSPTPGRTLSPTLGRTLSPTPPYLLLSLPPQHFKKQIEGRGGHSRCPPAVVVPPTYVDASSLLLTAIYGFGIDQARAPKCARPTLTARPLGLA